MEPGAQFDLRPNMKAKPNSQGTLFRASPDFRTPESRQPRGYSPERYAAVKSALTDEDSWSKIGDRVEGEHPWRQDQLTRTLARSTAPVEDIKKVDLWVTGMGPARDVKFNGRFAERKGLRGIQLANDRERTSTAVHELGHAIDHANQKPFFQDNSLASRGMREGSADDYAAQHYRQPGYKRKGLGESQHQVLARSSGWKHYVQPGQRHLSFTAGYQWARHETLGGHDDGKPRWEQGKLF